MKKFLAILMAICMMASLLCVQAFAADAPAAGVVLRATALLKDGKTTVLIEDYKNFEDGWNDAMEIAGSSSTMKKNGYDRIVVDIYTDWESDKDGNFTDDWFNGPGFDNDTIFIPDGARVTLNLNGHTIDRGLTKDRNDGEVIFIDDDADVIINNGTITGGYSNSEGGGLYIEGGANVTLNNVNLTGNAVKGDDGAAIYMYGDSTLTMNGGSVSNNFVEGKYVVVDNIVPYGTICVKDSTVILKNVTIDGNYTKSYSARGLAIYADGSTVTMENCTVSNNATKESVTKDIIYADDSNLTITNTNFIDNNTLEPPEKVSGLTPRLFYLEDSDLTMTGGDIAGNGGKELFYFYGSEADMTGVTIKYNHAVVVRVRNGAEVVNMTDCIIDQNRCTLDYNAEAFQLTKEGELVMTDCSLGNSTFNNKKYVTFVTTSVPEDENEDNTVPEDENEDNIVPEEEEIVVPPCSKDEALIGISGVLADGTTAFTEYYNNLPYAWNYAMDASLSGNYDHVVIDLYTDWTANEHGEFATADLEGSGIYKSTLCIPENARIILNLNDHTINRALTAICENGMVLLINKNADVTINDGTVTGGLSNNSAGGIHINGANVTLNNVCIYKNQTNGGNGTGIAVLDGATLTMNGGSLTENRVYNCGALYVNNSTAILDSVAISNNRSMASSSQAVAIYADNGTVTVSNCVVSSNAIFPQESVSSKSIIGGKNSIVTIENTEFTDNASNHPQSGYSTLLRFENSVLTMEGGSVIGNRPKELFTFEKSEANFHGVVVTDNTSQIFNVRNGEKDIFKVVTASECTFNNNNPVNNMEEVYVAFAGTLALLDCDLGDTVFAQKERITFSDQSVSDQAVASIFGGGSPSMIVALLALVTSGACLFLTVYNNKKKAVPATSNNVAESEDEE